MHLMILQGGAGNAVSAMLTALTAQVQPLAVPLAILGAVLWGLAILATPFLPEWASSMRGYFQKSLLVVGVIAFLPGIITFVAGIGGAG